MDMPKRIEDLTIEEAKEFISKNTIKNKQLDIQKADLRKKLNRLKAEKKALKEAKSKKISSIQDDINKANTKSAKDIKRKEKKRESASFESRLKSKELEIQSIMNMVLEIDKEKAFRSTVIEEIKLHISKIK